MRTILKVIPPTSIPFIVFARITALNGAHRQLNGPLTDISVNSLMQYFAFFGPLLYAILFLTQIVAVVPLWNKMYQSASKSNWIVALTVLFASLLLSAGLGYVVWDPTTTVLALISSVATLFTIQAIYWMVNMFLLYLVELAYSMKVRTQQSRS